jgi:hypothetical protein
MLASSFVEYTHSSAGFYELGSDGVYEGLVHYKEITG